MRTVRSQKNKGRIPDSAGIAGSGICLYHGKNLLFERPWKTGEKSEHFKAECISVTKESRPNTNPNTNSNANSNLSQGTAPAGCGACTDGEDGDERDLRERKEEIELSQEDRIMKDDPYDREDPPLERAVAAMEACCGITMTKGRREELAAFLRTLGEGSIRNAIELAESYGSRNWGYISRILRNRQENATTVRDRSVRRETESYDRGAYGRCLWSRSSDVSKTWADHLERIGTGGDPICLRGGVDLRKKGSPQVRTDPYLRRLEKRENEKRKEEKKRKLNNYTYILS